MLWAIGCSVLVAGGQESRPRPDRATFLAETRQRLDSDEQLQGRYTFKERRTEMRQDDSGAWVPKNTTLFEVYPSLVPDLTYYRLIERNGNRVSDHALAAADQKQLDELADFRKKLRNESPGDRVRRLARMKQGDDKDRAMVKDVLGTLDFSLVRREMVDGRSMIVVAFTPRDDAHPQTREGRVVQHFTGLAWVDEEQHQVVRAEAHSLDTLSFGWGILARFEQGMRGELVRRQIADGAWLPASARLAGAGRLFFFKKIEIGYVNHYFDYQKIDPNDPPRFVALPELALGASRHP